MPQSKPVATSAEYDSHGRYVGSKAVERRDKVAPMEVESEEDRNDRNELANAKEWDRPSILKRQQARKAAKAAASPSPSPSASPAKKAVNPNKPNEPF